jgi:hypothetical protein
VKLYRQAADAGDAVGMTNLGVAYSRGAGGLTRDDAEALRWIRHAAEKRESHGIYVLGWMHENGRGLAKDEKEALRLYREAAALGSAAAANRLRELNAN